MNGNTGPGPYDDIISLPHHISDVRPKMPISNRAAQFSPFAALTGYDAAIQETGRLTDERKDLAEGIVAALDTKLRMLRDMISDHPEVSVTYFQPDEKKEGGAYVTATGAVKKMDDYEGVLVLINGKKIAFENIIEVECELFRGLLE